MITSEIACRGFCNSCGCEHYLYRGNSKKAAIQLMEHLEKYKNIGRITPEQDTEVRLSTDFLFGDDRGKMFGVLECLDANNNSILLKAFSGQFNGCWEIDGWAPPLFATEKFVKITAEKEKEIKQLTFLIEQTSCNSPEREKLVTKRKRLSMKLMQEIHQLYKVHNFRGMTASLFNAFTKNGIPTGAGDCCAPKLLNLAARKKLKPVGITEFYWGKTNKSKTRSHKHIYQACQEKCQPLLGFMLCGIDHCYE